MVPGLSSATVQVDGELDLVCAHDLCRTVEATMQKGYRQIWLDLSRVQRVGEGCGPLLAACLERAHLQGVDLFLAALSGPTRDLDTATGLGGITRPGQGQGKAV